MAERPLHDLLVAEASRVSEARTLLARIDAFTTKTGIKISAPFCNFSGMWEVSEQPGGTTAYSNGFKMMSDLEARYRDE